HEVSLHGRGFAHRRTGVKLDRDLDPGFLQRARGLEDFIPRGGLPRHFDASLLEQVRAIEDLAHVRARRDTVYLALIAQDFLNTGADVIPAVPFVYHWPGDFLKRLEQPGADKFRHPEAIERHEVVAAAHAQVERVLLFELLVAAAELHQLNGDFAALRGHHFLEVWEDIGLQPYDEIVVDATLHAAAGERQVNRIILRQRRGCQADCTERKAERKQNCERKSRLRHG